MPNLCDLLCHGSGGQRTLKDKAQLVRWLPAAWAVLGLVRVVLLMGTHRDLPAHQHGLGAAICLLFMASSLCTVTPAACLGAWGCLTPTDTQRHPRFAGCTAP